MINPPYSNIIQNLIKESNIRLVHTDTDPETGAQTSNVVYLPDYKSVFNTLKKASVDIDKIESEDVELKELKTIVKSVFNRYRNYLRFKHPKEYKLLKNK